MCWLHSSQALTSLRHAALLFRMIALEGPQRLPAVTLCTAVYTWLEGRKKTGRECDTQTKCWRLTPLAHQQKFLLSYTALGKPVGINKEGFCLLGLRPGRESSVQLASTSTM